MARRAAHELQRPGPTEPHRQEHGTLAVIEVEAQLDVAGAAAVHGEILAALSHGAVRIEASDGKPTQPAIQLLVAARNSARAGHDVSFSRNVATLLSNVIEEGVLP